MSILFKQLEKRSLLMLGILLAIGSVSYAGPAAAKAEIANSAEEVSPLTVGQKAPTTQIFNSDGVAVSLQDVYSSAPTVLIFYRGGWCPYCNKHLAKLATIEDDLTSAGFQIVAVSPDKPEFLKETAAKQHLGYQLLSDSSANAIRAFGLAFRLDDGTVEKYLSFKPAINLEQRSGNTGHILPVPAAYVIDTSGTIRFAFWSPDYKKRVNEKDLLDAALAIRAVR